MMEVEHVLWFCFGTHVAFLLLFGWTLGICPSAAPANIGVVVGSIGLVATCVIYWLHWRAQRRARLNYEPVAAAAAAAAAQ